MHHFFVFVFRYHCTQCYDFDLCYTCYSREGHPHRMLKFGFDLGSTADADRVTAIQRCINSLMHACQCQDANCQSPSCRKMKRVVSHTRQCRRKSDGGCPICKQLIALCCYHAKVCQEAKCPAYFCQNIKQKLRQQPQHEQGPQQQQWQEQTDFNIPQQQQQQLQQQQQQQQGQPEQAGQPGVPGQADGGAGQPKPTMQSLQQLITALRSPNYNTQQQQQEVMNILQANPNLMAAFLKQRNQQQRQQGGASGVQQDTQQVVTSSGAPGDLLRPPQPQQMQMQQSQQQQQLTLPQQQPPGTSGIPGLACTGGPPTNQDPARKDQDAITSGGTVQLVSRFPFSLIEP